MSKVKQYDDCMNDASLRVLEFGDAVEFDGYDDVSHEITEVILKKDDVVSLVAQLTEWLGRKI